jgi:hypothetical protein
MSDITTALQFILTSATEADLERVWDAAKERRKALGRITAASVTVGAQVRLDGLSPKYLNGLAGTVVDIKGARCTVLLDQSSAERLSFRRFIVRGEDGTYRMNGIPLQCAKVDA